MKFLKFKAVYVLIFILVSVVATMAVADQGVAGDYGSPAQLAGQGQGRTAGDPC